VCRQNLSTQITVGVAFFSVLSAANHPARVQAQILDGPSNRAGLVIYVDASADGLGNGSSWCQAFRELHKALSRASAGTIILVANGTYIPDPIGLTDQRDATFHLYGGVIIGGATQGAGQLTPMRETSRCTKRSSAVTFMVTTIQRTRVVRAVRAVRCTTRGDAMTRSAKLKFAPYSRRVVFQRTAGMQPALN